MVVVVVAVGAWATPPPPELDWVVELSLTILLALSSDIVLKF
jgi:hypothetical protein